MGLAAEFTSLTQPGRSPKGVVDLAVLVHSSEVGARTKARMAAGPMLFTHCESAAEVPLLVADLLRSCPDGDLVGARQRVLHGEVRAIAYRFPEVADDLEKALAACGPAASSGCTV